MSNSIFEQKYKNKYDINNICFYPIHLHSYLQAIDCRFAARAIYSLPLWRVGETGENWPLPVLPFKILGYSMTRIICSKPLITV